MRLVIRSSFLVALCVIALQRSAASAQEKKYLDFDDAYAEAARSARRGDYPAAVAPLEAALGLAKDDAQRKKAYEALVPAYRLQPEIDKLFAAQEFIIRHTERRAGRSIAAREVASFAYTRGKLDATIERYDAQLKKDPNDPAALSILTAIFTQVRRDTSRGTELKQRLEELDRDLARQLAERLEKDAEVAPRTSGWHLKDAATAWLEAGDKTKAVATAKKSAAGPAENRNQQLTQMWHEGLGDVFLQTGEPQLAISHFEVALANTDQPITKKGLEKKLAEARGVASTK